MLRYYRDRCSTYAAEDLKNPAENAVFCWMKADKSLQGLWETVYVWEFWNVHLLTTEFDCPEVTLCGWQDVKVQLLITFFVVVAELKISFLFCQALKIKVFFMLVCNPALCLYYHFQVKVFFCRVCIQLMQTSSDKILLSPLPSIFHLTPVPRTNSQSYSLFLPYMRKVALLVDVRACPLMPKKMSRSLIMQLVLITIPIDFVNNTYKNYVICSCSKPLY